MNTLDDLLAAIVGAPALPGARCRGRHHMFDPAAFGEDPAIVEARHTQALGLCAQCPALERCGEWLDSLPAKRQPLGVIAGQRRIPNPVGRPERSTQ